jgi:hypothetical protein
MFPSGILTAHARRGALQSGAAELDKSSLHSEPASVFNNLSWRSDQMTRFHVTKKPENHQKPKKNCKKKKKKKKRSENEVK